MTTIFTSSVFKNILSIPKKYVYYFLYLIFMLYSNSVFSQLVSNFTTISSNTGCGSLVVEFEDLSTGNPNTWLWDFGNGNTSNLQNPVSLYPFAGFYTVSLTISDGITNDISTFVNYIKVYEKPIADLSVGMTSICVPNELDFSDESHYSNNILSWIWDFGDGGSSNMQNPTYEYSDPGLYTVSLSVIDDRGCESLVIMDNLIDAKEVPIADFDLDISTSCDPFEIISFQNNSQYSISYDWNFGDGQSSNTQNPQHNYSSGIYDIKLVADNGVCADTLIQNNLIEIGAIVITDFESNVSSICKNNNVQFTDISNYNPDTWSWDFGDGQTSTLQNPSHIYQDAGIYTVSLTTSKNGECISIIEKIDLIEVFEDIEINISSNDTVSCTLPFHVSFQDNTTNAISWNWNFENGDSSNLQNPNIVFNTYDNFDVELTVTDINGCVSTITETDFIITDMLKPDLSISDSIICDSDIIDFTDLSTSFFPITYYLWDFGDGQISTSQNPQHQFVGVNTFDITLSIENDQGCSEELILTSLIKTVGPATSDFEADRLISCAGENINFTDLSSSSTIISSWEWDFGDGSSSVIQNPTYQYNQTGNFDVTLITGEGICTDTLIKNLYIKIIEPSAFFIPEYNCVEPLMVNFSNESSGADFVEWDFGDGFTSTDFDPIHVYSTPGVYNVSLKVTNNVTLCTHEYIEQVHVFFPIADFTYFINSHNSLEDSVVCLPNRRSYIEILSPNVRNYRIDWGDGYLGFNRVDHLYTTPGIYDVTLMITDDHTCKDTLVIEDMFRVTQVETDFAINNVQGCNTLTVDFEDLSSVTSYVIWDFGDGSTSFLNNPQHVYTNEGFYDITLFSKSIDGCKDTLVIEDYIKFVYPEIDFDISDDKICKNDEVVFVDSSKGISLEYNWDFGDGTTSSSISPIHSFNSIGVFPISLIITDTFGCVSVKNVDTIKVQEVEANFTSNTITSNCPPLITTFSNQSVGNIINYTWDFGDGLNSSQISPSHLYSFSGEFDVQLVVEDDFACKDTLKYINLISIFGPSGSFTFSTNTMCHYDSVEFTSNVQNTDLYLWDFGDGIFSTDSHPTHSYSSGSYFHPTLVIENSSSCQIIVSSDDSIQVVEITVDAGLDKLLCFGDTVLLESIGSATNYIWNSSPYLLQDSIANTLAFPLENNMFYITNSDGMCFATDSVFVIVDTNIPEPFFTTLKNCYLDSMELYGDAGINASSFSWEWTILGQNLYSQDDYFQFDTIGLYNVDLLVKNLDNNCDAKTSQIVEVLPLPQVNFRTDEVCFGQKTNFTNLSGSDVTSVLWSFGDGYQSSSNSNPSILFSSPGIFNSTLVVNSDLGCLNAITKEVLVHENPEVFLNISEVCEGFESEFTSIIVLNDGYITDWTWDFGDASILSDTEHNSHVYEKWGAFDVSLQVRSNFGCISSVNEQAIVNPNPEILFDVEQICKGDITRFTSQASIIEGDILHYSWSFGDGNTSVFTNSSNEYSQAGIYPVNLLVSSAKGCSSNLEKQIKIFDLPEVHFLVDREVCELEQINFINNTNSDDIIIEYNWDFGDRIISSEKNPSHSYKNSGIYDVLLSVETVNGCKNLNFKDSFIIVHKNPIAEFDMSDRRVSVLDSEVLFTNNSGSDLFFEWDFDNGIIDSDNTDVIINFIEAGNYDVLLYVENDIGCSDEITHQVIVGEEFSVFVPTAFTPNNDGLNDEFLSSTQGVYEFEMKIFNRWGELIFSSDNKDFGWDGYSSNTGNFMENGTYLYSIRVTDYNDKTWVYNGEVNLMK